MMHLLTGFSAFLLRELDAVAPPGSVLVLEEPDVAARRRVASRITAHPCVARVAEAPIQHPDFADGMGLPDLPAGIDSVAPGTEYGVTAAAVLAARLGLPGIGVAAAPVFGDKQLLRRTLAGAVPQPRWAPLTSSELAR
ncbi:MAG TPA: hypothetical protein VGS19_22570, partial [Streptosporangiaceae bacterium]|nr:hypothetical protein [Streptosporangiaceae bacterium]